MRLEIRLDEAKVAPGGELTGDVLVHEGGSSRALTLTLSFRERSPSFQAEPFSKGTVVHEGDLSTGETIAFRCAVPAWATPGVRGKDAELLWELEAVSDRPGLDARAPTAVEVRPR